jgi:hypothetical protein
MATQVHQQALRDFDTCRIPVSVKLAQQPVGELVIVERFIVERFIGERSVNERSLIFQQQFRNTVVCKLFKRERQRGRRDSLDNRVHCFKEERDETYERAAAK